MSRETFIRVCKDYQGTLHPTDNGLKFTSNNKIRCYYTNGQVAKERVVECVMTWDERYGFGGEEKSFEIIGGFGFGDATEKEMRHQFDRYNFKRKAEEQLSLFDL